MGAKGTIAKENFMNKIISQNQDIYIGCYDKKYYFWSSENGENMQIAISITCPKNQIESTSFVAATAEKPKEDKISEEELKNIEELMKKLGL